MSSSGTSDLTGSSRDRRKLVAVVYADMVGYSRLIGLDDAGTLERLRALRGNLIDPAISDHGGRIVQTGGDSLLIVFDSIDGAVRCAVKLQQQVPIHDADQPPDRAIRFRIGINIGDAIARWHRLAWRRSERCRTAPGRMPSGRNLRVSLGSRSRAWPAQFRRFANLVQLSLKNIARPIEAFLVGSDISEHSEILANHRRRR